jgi:hypothetical protein
MSGYIAGFLVYTAIIFWLVPAVEKVAVAVHDLANATRGR